MKYPNRTKRDRLPRRSPLQVAILRVEAQLRREFGESAVRDLWAEITRRTRKDSLKRSVTHPPSKPAIESADRGRSGGPASPRWPGNGVVPWP
jgi:hypothetical protein